ncbi:MAG: transporter substrate-binding domain-containing protein [Victivallales bacterium]|nr:transporter substrate-binding domain-containing protein [Victivallales bacterium]
MMDRLKLFVLLRGGIFVVSAMFSSFSVNYSAFGAASSARELISACEIDYPPFCFVDENGEASGFSVELLRCALEAMGAQVSFKVGVWSDVKAMLEEGEVEVLPLVGRTPEREALFDFSFSYISMYGAIVVRRDTKGINTVGDLSGKDVAVMSNDNAEEYLFREDRGLRIHSKPSFEVALKDLSEGKHDAVVMQRLVAYRLISEMGMDNLRVIPRFIEDFKQDFCLAVRKGDSETLALLNEGLSIVMADGTFRRLQARWFSGIELPDRERLLVGGDHNYPPFEFNDKRGIPKGYNVDLTHALAKATKLPLRVDLGPWDEMVRKLESGEIDLLQGMFYSPERAERFLFSDPHDTASYVSVVRAGTFSPPGSLDKLRGLRLAVQRGGFVFDSLSAAGLSDGFVLCASQEDVLAAVSSGRADCGLVVRITALKTIDLQGIAGLRLSGKPLVTAEYCYAARKDSASLISRINEGLRVLKDSGEYRSIRKGWFGPYEDEPLSVLDMLRDSAVLIVPLGLILLLALLWSWSLHRQVGRATRDVRQRGEFIRKILDNLPVGVAVNSLGPEVKFEYMNDRFVEIYRASRKELEKPDNFWEAVYRDPGLRREIRERVEADFSSGDVSRMHWEEIPITREGEDTTYVNASCLPLEVGDGMVISTVIDVTEQRRGEIEREGLRKQLERSQKLELVGQLAGGIAHDFNNALSVILGCAEMALDHPAGKAGADAHLKSILQAGRHAAKLTAQLLAFSRKQVMKPVTLDMNEVVGDFLDVLKHAVGEGIKICWKPGDGLWHVKADISQLEQILTNLCVNARDAIESVADHKGEICISTRNDDLDFTFSEMHPDTSPGEYVRLEISDNGCGMAPEVLEKIYEPFFTTKDLGKGTGLGMAVVYGIVRQHRGFIDIKSSPGGGSSISIYLPRDESALADGFRTDKVETDPEIMKGKTVLLVEDNSSIRVMVEEILKEKGMEVFGFPKPSEAIVFAEAHPKKIDLLISDMVMPEMGGEDVLAEILKKRPEIRCLFMSGYAADEPFDHARPNVCFLPKPFSISDLAHKVQEVLLS